MAGVSNISQKGIDFIKSLEGFSGVAYEINGVPHIGYGFNLNYHDLGNTMTREAADDYLRHILNTMYEPEVRNINAALNQSQYDALTSFKYNVGHIPNALKSLLSSGMYAAAADFIRRNYTTPNLTDRRAKEADYFSSGGSYLVYIIIVLALAGGLYLYSKSGKK